VFHYVKGSLYLSHANCAHAYGRAISSSGFIDVATLRERVSRESANSINSGGRGPLNVGIKPVRACSMLARLILGDDLCWFEGGLGMLVHCRCAGASRTRAVTWSLGPPLLVVQQHRCVFLPRLLTTSTMPSNPRVTSHQSPRHQVFVRSLIQTSSPCVTCTAVQVCTILHS